MCGLLFCYSKKKIDTKKFEKALSLQKHRGPDHTGIKQINSHTIFGHVRLSILDTSKASNQPFINKSTSNILIFNGEIYNYLELKRKLKKNTSFNTQGDTEVLLKLLEKEGVKSIQKLNGAYAFVFYDSNKKKIIVSRDRFGKKPLYYYENNDNLIISSEIKSIFKYLSTKRVVRKSHLKSFIDFNYLPNENEQTLYYGINQFMPGSIYQFELGGKNKKKSKSNKNTLKNFINYKTSMPLNEVIKDSVGIRLRSDVKTAVLVSGGIDSAIVATNAKKLSRKIIFVKGYMGKDEDQYFAEKLSKKIKIDLVNIPIKEEPKKILKRIDSITKNMEAPIPIVGITIPTDIMYEKISKMGIKVVLDGNGGDEVFGGYYDRYSRYYINSCIENFEIFNLIKFIFSGKKNNLKIKTLLKYTFQKICNYLFKINFEEKIFQNTKLSLKSLNPYLKKKIFSNLEEFQLWDAEFGSTQRMLKLWDNSVMMNSVESRSPLFDFRQIYNMNENNNQKFFNGLNKFRLRNSLPDNINEIKFRESKQPLKWDFKEELIKIKKKFILDEIEKSKLIKTLINSKEIKKLLKYENSNYDKEKVLRLYSVARFDKIYNIHIK